MISDERLKQLSEIETCVGTTGEMMSIAKELLALRKVREGWKLVPVEPTTQQWAAGVKAMDAGIDKPTLCYSAMLAAAPEVSCELV